MIKKLNFLGFVFYVVVYLDDENIRFIVYLVNEVKVIMVYLLFIRGDGG